MKRLLPQRTPIRQEAPNELNALRINEEAAEDVFSALASKMSREILSELYTTPQNASDLSDTVETSIQNTKYHLDKLRDADLIEVVDTWYSDSGSEMKVYAPTNGSLVIFATEKKNESNLRKTLARFLGAIAIVGIASKLIDHLVRPTNDPQSNVVATNPSLNPETAGQIVSLSPGELFFWIGLIAIVFTFSWRHHARVLG
ncbi:helix-turn-helix domain-containing protein [Halobacteria archaeon HArc-gm2]|nr:helix-turn-helix domain-containing protein [Halobacteria archaeon HArc-gm2]